jgi:hypothetical protein
MAVGETYTVGPDARGGWKIEKNGTVVRAEISTKQQALSQARQFADRNDTVTVQASDGRFQERFNPR